MKKFIFPFVFMFLSCTANKSVPVISSQRDYLLYNNQKYIQIEVDTLQKTIGINSHWKFRIINEQKEFVYIFSTVLSWDNMFYSKNNIQISASSIRFDSYYPNFMNDAYGSFIRKFNFIELKPHETLDIFIDTNKIPQNSFDNRNVTLKYYYFKKDAQQANGLLNISKTKISSKVITITSF